MEIKFSTPEHLKNIIVHEIVQQDDQTVLCIFCITETEKNLIAEIEISDQTKSLKQKSDREESIVFLSPSKITLTTEQAVILFDDLTKLSSHGDYDPPFKLSVQGNKVKVTSIPGIYNNFSGEEDAIPFYVLDEYKPVEVIFAQSIKALGARDFEDLIGNLLECPDDIYSIEFDSVSPKEVILLGEKYIHTFRD